MDLSSPVHVCPNPEDDVFKPESARHSPSSPRTTPGVPNESEYQEPELQLDSVPSPTTGSPFTDQSSPHTPSKKLPSPKRKSKSPLKRALDAAVRILTSPCTITTSPNSEGSRRSKKRSPGTAKQFSSPPKMKLAGIQSANSPTYGGSDLGYSPPRVVPGKVRFSKTEAGNQHLSKLGEAELKHTLRMVESPTHEQWPIYNSSNSTPPRYGLRNSEEVERSPNRVLKTECELPIATKATACTCQRQGAWGPQEGDHGLGLSLFPTPTRNFRKTKMSHCTLSIGKISTFGVDFSVGAESNGHRDGEGDGSARSKDQTSTNTFDAAGRLNTGDENARDDYVKDEGKDLNLGFVASPKSLRRGYYNHGNNVNNNTCNNYHNYTYKNSNPTYRYPQRRRRHPSAPKLSVGQISVFECEFASEQQTPHIEFNFSRPMTGHRRSRNGSFSTRSSSLSCPATLHRRSVHSHIRAQNSLRRSKQFRYPPATSSGNISVSSSIVSSEAPPSTCSSIMEENIMDGLSIATPSSQITDVSECQSPVSTAPVNFSRKGTPRKIRIAYTDSENVTEKQAVAITPFPRVSPSQRRVSSGGEGAKRFSYKFAGALAEYIKPTKAVCVTISPPKEWC